MVNIQTAIVELVCLIPFLIPFTLTKNIDVQSLVTILTGILSVYIIFIWRKGFKLPSWLISLLIVYLLFLLFNLAYYHSFNNTFGAPRIRLGGLALAACVVCGLALLSVESKKLCSWLFGMSAILAATSVPYMFNIFSPSRRLGGIFRQPDFLAVFLGIGLILGAGLIYTYPKYKKYIYACLVLIYGSLMLTQTRVVIWTALVILSLIIIFEFKNKALAIVCAAVLIAGSLGFQSLLAKPFVNRAGAKESFTYRMDLELSAIKSTSKHPLTGYGISNVKTALACRNLTYQPLRQTCKQGYYFNSSHNVYLDRIVELGWIGGLSFTLLIILSLLRGLKTRGINGYLVLAAVLVATYYLSNPTNIAIELIFWILILRPHIDRKLA